MRFSLIIILCFYLSSTLFSQTPKDAGLWATLSVQHKLKEKLSVIVDQELRLKENYQRLNLLYTNFGVSYKPFKFLKIEPTIRTIQKMKYEGYFSFRHRFMLDVILKKKFEKITIGERVRYQTEVQDYNTNKKGKLFEQFLRFKTDLKYALTEKITPYASCELRYQIHAPRGDGPSFDNGFHRIRNVLGCEYELNKKSSVNVYYLIQSEFTISSPETIFILGLGYSITI